MKPFLNIDQQIILTYSRGMKIENTIKFKEFLERKNYYNSVNVYGKMFRKFPYSDKYVKGSTSDELMQIYYFEKEVRNAIFKRIIETETNLKSTIAYYFSLEYESDTRDNPYLNIDFYKPNVKSNRHEYDNFVKLRKTFQRILTNKYKPYLSGVSSSVDHYIKKVGYVPLWVIIDELTFGEVEMMYNLLEQPLQDKICKSFGRSLRKSYGVIVQIKSTQLSSYIKGLRNLRNLVMHDRCLLYFSLHDNIMYNNFLHKSRRMSKKSGKQSLYDALIAIQMFVSKRNFDAFLKNLNKLARKTNKKVKSIQFEGVLDLYGFPQGWLSSDGVDYNISLL